MLAKPMNLYWITKLKDKKKQKHAMEQNKRQKIKTKKIYNIYI